MTISTDVKAVEAIWDEFLEEWPIERLRKMTIEEYTAIGNRNTLTAWIERRLDTVGSIWGGSSFKFGIFARKNQTHRDGGGGDSYTKEYGWYSKYGASPKEAFQRVRSLVVRTAEMAQAGNFEAIDDIDLGKAYKWKIAFHYQDRSVPGVIAAFKPSRLRAWLEARDITAPAEMSGLYREVLKSRGATPLLAFSSSVWNETAASEENDAPSPSGQPVEEDVVVGVSANDSPIPLNLILFGPPGTGKTYATAEMAVQTCDGALPADRGALMARYRELRDSRRIRFVTFHPSFSYEEFVEGIRPSVQNGNVSYDVRSGVLKQAVAEARKLFDRRSETGPLFDIAGRRLFKMSLGDTSKREEDWIYPDCIDNSYVCVGFAHKIDFTGADSLAEVRSTRIAAKPEATESDFSIQVLQRFKNEMREGDLVLISDGNTKFRAVGEITGPYAFQPRELGYPHRRQVRWLWSAPESVPVDSILGKRLSQQTIYMIDQTAVKWPALKELIAPKRDGQSAANCVLVIDEINRANLAKTFGELITLLEPSKRLGQLDEREVELPYSGDRFGIPPNLYVIGTMNTADRSIALMDTALRRRFEFQEMVPMPGLLEPDVDGIDLRALLTAMNQRIEALFDRDHVIGHSYLMGLDSFDDIETRFRNQLIPLLQEYFFEDWQKIRAVFADTDAAVDLQIIQAVSTPSVGGDSSVRSFRVSQDIRPAAVKKIYE